MIYFNNKLSLLVDQHQRFQVSSDQPPFNKDPDVTITSPVSQVRFSCAPLQSPSWPSASLTNENFKPSSQDLWPWELVQQQGSLCHLWHLFYGERKDLFHFMPPQSASRSPVAPCQPTTSLPDLGPFSDSSPDLVPLSDFSIDSGAIRVLCVIQRRREQKW